MMRDLSESELVEAVLHISESGFAVLRDMLSAEEVRDFAHELDQRVSQGPTSGECFGRGLTNDLVVYASHALTVAPLAVEVATSSAVEEVISAYLQGPAYASYVSAYRTKGLTSSNAKRRHQQPGVFAGWHSDTVESDRGHNAAVAMLYLTNTTEKDGPLEVIAGSHKYGNSQREWYPEQDIPEFASRVQRVTMSAGSIVLFDMDAVHRAGVPIPGNHRDLYRVMYSPIGGYCEPLVLVSDFLPHDPSERVKRLLRLGSRSTCPIGSAVERPKSGTWTTLRSMLGSVRHARL